MREHRFSVLTSVMLLLFAPALRAQNRAAAHVGDCLEALTQTMIHDITSPLVASRDYAYTSIAFYEAARFENRQYKSFAGQLNGLKELPQPADSMYDWETAGQSSFYTAAYAFVFSKDIFQHYWDSIQPVIKKKNISKEVYERSVAYGRQVGKQILAWAAGDNYIHTRTLQRYTPSKEPGTWQPTPPDYMEAVEPYWNQIRTMVLTKADEVTAPPPAPYKSEKFMAEWKEVYETKKNLTKEQTWMANFWDCNPYATRTVGHLMYSIKKVTPGGHWMGITRIAIRDAKLALVPALASYSQVAIAMFDAFIVCWDIKYKTNYIRPVTTIQQMVAPDFDPVLQTPPFPEYPSGHSICSMSAATVLTKIFGPSFHYVDNSEVPYGVPARSYPSFVDAAKEAAISRMYGGIHFREAIENGSAAGRDVGALVNKRIALK